MVRLADNRWRITSHSSPSWAHERAAQRLDGREKVIYSVWADGERIGETRLELRPSPRRRTGAFSPTLSGLARLRDIARPGSACTLEVRDPAGFRIRSDSVAITDLEQMVAAARARRPGIVSEASAGVCGSIRFVISLTLDLRDSEMLDNALSRAEHLAAERGQPAAN